MGWGTSLSPLKRRHTYKREKGNTTNFTTSVCLSIRKDSCILRKDMFFRLLKLLYQKIQSQRISNVCLEKYPIPTSLSTMSSTQFDRVADQECSSTAAWSHQSLFYITCSFSSTLVSRAQGEKLLLSCLKSNHVFSLLAVGCIHSIKHLTVGPHEHQSRCKREGGEVLVKDTAGRERGWTAITGTGLGCRSTSSAWRLPEDIIQTQDTVCSVAFNMGIAIHASNILCWFWLG